VAKKAKKRRFGVNTPKPKRRNCGHTQRRGTASQENRQTHQAQRSRSGARKPGAWVSASDISANKLTRARYCYFLVAPASYRLAHLEPPRTGG